jgi:predicted PurR-regulated permease PerM
LLLGSLALLLGLAEPLFLLFLAVVIAEALAPVVTKLQRWMPRLAAIILIYSVLLALAVGFVLFVVPPLVTETQKAANDLPHLLSRAAALINRVAPGAVNRIITAL